MGVAIIVVITVLLIFGLLFVIGTVSSISAVDDLYREFDDREQEEYIRKWSEEKKQRQDAKAKRKRR